MFNMSITEEILKELWKTEFNYKGVKVNIFGIPHFNKYLKRNVRTSIDRLKKRGLIEKELAGIVLSKSGKVYIKRKIDSLKKFDRPKNISKNKNLLVVFDIPIEKKAEREWFRWHLKKFDYEMVQHSVWVGPSPLPKNFIKYVEEIKLKKCIETFKLSAFYKKNKK